MFKKEYILELISGRLSEDGYRHFLGTISHLIKKFRWPKRIIAENELKSFQEWNWDEVEEFAHQFFEWAIIKGKFKYFEKVPESYISYYFHQILISFVAEKIKGQQKKHGISYEKASSLVKEILIEKYFEKKIGQIFYWFNRDFEESDRKDIDADYIIKYLQIIPISASTKHYKPLVAMAIQNIFEFADTAITEKQLCKIVYQLLDQSFLSNTNGFSSEDDSNNYIRSVEEHVLAINKITLKISKIEAKIFSEYLFQSTEQISFSELSIKYGIPKSTVHNKIERFKQKIAEFYIPLNEADGSSFIELLHRKLDELSN